MTREVRLTEALGPEVPDERKEDSGRGRGERASLEDARIRADVGGLGSFGGNRRTFATRLERQSVAQRFEPSGKDNEDSRRIVPFSVRPQNSTKFRNLFADRG
jgi:hypothetical protein